MPREHFVYTANGAIRAITDCAEHAIDLLNYAEKATPFYGMKATNQLLVGHLADIHYNLARMCEKEPKRDAISFDADDPATYPKVYGQTNQMDRLVKDLHAVIGAVNDRWLYAEDEAYQQAAVITIKKMFTVFTEWLTPTVG